MSLQYKHQYLHYPKKEHLELLQGNIPNKAEEFFIYPCDKKITNPIRLKELVHEYILNDDNLVLGLESQTKKVACMILTYQDGVCLESETKTLVLY